MAQGDPGFLVVILLPPEGIRLSEGLVQVVPVTHLEAARLPNVFGAAGGK